MVTVTLTSQPCKGALKTRQRTLIKKCRVRRIYIVMHKVDELFFYLAKLGGTFS